MSKYEESNLIVERGLFIFERASLTEYPECDLDFYNSQFFDEIQTTCEVNAFPPDQKIFARKPDGTICYCYCRGPSSSTTTNLTA